MKGQTTFAPSCSGSNFWLGQSYEVAWVKASFHVDWGATIAAIKIGETTVAEKAISAGQDVVLEGRLTPVTTEFILLGLYPVSAAISDITLEWADKAQAPSAGFDFGKIVDWIKANPVLAGAIAIGAYLVVRGR